MPRTLLLLVALSMFPFLGCSPRTDDTNGAFILYGVPDTTPEHEAVVMIVFSQGGCSGTLITEDVVLTAGHCIDHPSNMQVYFGNQDPFNDMRYVSVAQAHPGWNPDDPYDLSNDIGLLRLSSPAPQGITPIQVLPPSLAITSADIDTLTLNSVGFGVTETGDAGEKRQMWQTLRFVCELSTGGCNVNVDIPGMGTQQLQMPGGTIAITMDENGGICHGDSGGPALVELGGQEYVAGVHSFVIHNDQDVCDYFGASTKVDNFNQFIEDFVSAEVCNNGTDDDGDGDIDCDDVDCEQAENCLPSACDAPVVISCGDTITESTNSSTATSAWSYYNDTCTAGFTVDGAEIAFALNAEQGSEVTVVVDFPDAERDLELLLLKGGCEAARCAEASTNPPGVQESLTFTTDGQAHFLMVDTWQNAGTFTISVVCSDPPPPQEECYNGLDDDGDGATDCEDDDCAGIEACQSGEVCNNQVDDDDDGFIDCDDADCFHAQVCTNRVELCDNELDDDDDGAVDCDDADCITSEFCDAVLHEICDNGVDDNGDGRVDCNDPLCKTAAACPHPIEVCDNGTDDDGDHLSDCDDADCHSHASCSPPQGEVCLNDLDDDGNGLVDCEDEACASHHYCVMQQSGYTPSAKDGCTCAAGAGSPPHSRFLLLILLLAGFMVRRRAV